MSIEYRTTGPPVGNSGSPLIGELQAVFDVLDDTEIVARLSAYRWTGRKGWSLQTLWKSYVAAYAMNIATTNDLIRRLQDDAPLRFICGFDDGLPSRWTFNRFYIRLAAHSDLVEKCLDSVTDQLGQLLPGFGSSVAVDATTVRTHSNPDKRIVSDAKASWTAKQGTQGKKIWHFGTSSTWLLTPSTSYPWDSRSPRRSVRTLRSSFPRSNGPYSGTDGSARKPFRPTLGMTPMQITNLQWLSGHPP